MLLLFTMFLSLQSDDSAGNGQSRRCICYYCFYVIIVSMFLSLQPEDYVGNGQYGGCICGPGRSGPFCQEDYPACQTDPCYDGKYISLLDL